MDISRNLFIPSAEEVCMKTNTLLPLAILPLSIAACAQAPLTKPASVAPTTAATIAAPTPATTVASGLESAPTSDTAQHQPGKINPQLFKLDDVKATHLRIIGDTLAFCIAGRGYKLDSERSEVLVFPPACMGETEANPHCLFKEGGSIVIPSKSKPHDTLLVNNEGHSLAGHSKDCAKDGDAVFIATDKGLQYFDSYESKFYTMHKAPTSTVVSSSGWLAWLDDSHLYARRISSRAAILK